MRSWAALFLLLIALTSFDPAIASTAGVTAVETGPRQLIPLSGAGWQFIGGKDADTLPPIDSDAFNSAAWTDVTVPHAFQDRRSIEIEQGWYRSQVNVPANLGHAHLYLVFEGAATVADVYVNGQHLGQHRGAFTRFVFDATSALHPGADNELAVQVDNRVGSKTDCLPSASADKSLYTVWGGLYRHVWLLATNDLHIDPTYYASPGVFITPSEVTSQSAKVDLKVMLRNTSAAAKTAEIKATILDPKNQVVQTLTSSANVAANNKVTVDLTGSVSNPLPWTPSTPNLYHVQVDVSEAGQVTDSITQPLGFHNIVWDFKKRTMQLNGQPFPLLGVNLHQEVEGKVSAVEPEDLIANFDTMQDLGVNFVRLAHYPRAQLEYDLCDQRGLFCWSENGHSHDDIVSPTADLITTEMVEQNYNHPSIILWSVGNEGTQIVAEAEVPVVKGLDATRPTIVAGMDKCGAVDMHGANEYPGWYGADRWKFKPSGSISEIGAGGVVSAHTDYAAAQHKVDSYEPEEYQQLVAETEYEQVFRHDQGKFGMFTWWTLRDFNDRKYKWKEAPFHHGLNTKGLLTYEGDKKDVYYLYRSFLRPDEPTLHITSKRYFLRQGAVDNGIKVYSNAKSVTLKLNGEIVSTLNNGQYSQPPSPFYPDTEIDNVFYWPVPLHTGKNVVTATADRGQTDSATIYFYGANGLPELPVESPLVKDLASSNAANPAYYMDMPVQAQWPIYYDFDTTADNTLNQIPDALQGANWLALRRVTKAGYATDVSFTVTKPATVSVLCTQKGQAPAWLASVSFTEVKSGPITWRDNENILIPAQLYSRHVAAGEKVTLSLGDRDALVLLKAD